jgi:hypothetical protein
VLDSTVQPISRMTSLINTSSMIRDSATHPVFDAHQLEGSVTAGSINTSVPASTTKQTARSIITHTCTRPPRGRL